MDSDSEDHSICAPPEIREAGDSILQNLLPEKSQNRYKGAYKNFQDWCSSKNIDSSITEDLLLTYFSELNNVYKASSLWTFYSMLRSTLSINHGINIENYSRLRAFLKRQSETHIVKKAKTFTPEQLNSFINEAPDDNYLATKVALIMGIMGACRASELYSMQITDLEEQGNILLVSVPNTISKIARKFIITGNLCNIVKKYINLRPANLSQTILFYKFKNGRFHSQRIGINKFGGMGKDIAIYLKLPDSNLYTGHCFRRASAISIGDNLEDTATRDRQNSFSSATETEEYIDESEDNKEDIANKIYNSMRPEAESTPTAFMQQTQEETINLHNSIPHIHFHGCSNFTVNIINKRDD